MFTSEDTFRSILASKPIFIFDTNIYLNLLRYSKKASSELLNLYQVIIEDIRIPAQVNRELNKNISIVDSQRIGNLKKAGTDIKNAINNCTSSISTHLEVFLRLKFPDAAELSTGKKAELTQIKKDIEDYIDAIVSDSNSFLVVSDLTDFIEAIWTANSKESYPPSTLMRIYTDGSIRYRYMIPPGYMDDPQQNKDSSKQGVDIFGDLILWNEIIDFGCQEKRPIVFVTADVKEDWFALRGKVPTEPRPELIAEFNEKTDGISICILTSDLFVDYLSKAKSVDTGEALLEMQMDDYVDISIRNNREDIIKELVAWGNKSENILQFPFSEDIKQLTYINSFRYVVKGTSLQLRDKIEYSVILEGAADFFAILTDEAKRLYASPEIKAAFQFDLQVVLSRPYGRDQDGKLVPDKKIDSIQIKNAAIEAIPSTDIPLESRRGVFVLPTEDDKEIYAYMESVWDSYEKANSVDKAEALVYFDAANYFDITLLEVNRAYTLVQNVKSNLTLSLNEIDSLALKRFADIRITMENGIAKYGELTASIGEAYPIPESMMLLPPEAGKELKVEFATEAEHVDGKYVVCKGSTNLPPDTHLLITLRTADKKYMAQSKATVGEDGFFQSDTFTNSKNPPNNEMLAGKYSAEIVVPIVSVQPDSVKTIFGQKGRNLIGEYVTQDQTFGNTIRYTKEFDI